MSTLIESLLYQSEGTALDFKKEQYPFQKATDEQKSELLKDILAFANSWRQNEAYIVIGLEDVVGGRHIPVGTEDHFDDSRLQQFINGKTNRKVKLAYEVHLFEGKKIGVIRIPKQERPIYATKNYGKVKKEAVYYRLGSSTEIANPDDIARMGKDSEKHIQLEANLDNAQRVSKRKLRKQAWSGYLICALGIILFAIFISFNFLNTGSILSWWYLIVLIPAIIIFVYFLKPYLDAMSLFYNRPTKSDEAIFVGEGRLMEIKNNTHFLIYNPTAKCIYPNCSEGEIIIVYAPNREVSRLGKKYVGVCSIAGKDHSYYIDNIGVATPERFDWRPLNK